MADINSMAYLYKYRPLSGPASHWTQEIIVKNALYFPSPADFNDPFDCVPVVTLDSSEAEFEEHAKALIKRRQPNMSRAERRHSVREAKRAKPEWARRYPVIISEVVNSAGICSLSEKCDDVLMWSHYSDSHRGICLRFKLSVSAPFFVKAQQVRYQENRPVINVIRDSKAKILDGALLTKAIYWSYEKEWRIILPEQPRQTVHFSPDLLDGVIFGAKISADNRSNVLKWIGQRKSQPEILEARFHPEKFALQIEKAS